MNYTKYSIENLLEPIKITGSGQLTLDNIERLVYYQAKSKYKTYSNTGTNKRLMTLLEALKLYAF